jgi:ribose transport system ATP-binding protein
MLEIAMSNIVEMVDVTKMFYGIAALNKVNFNLLSGEIHGLLGENGAGKSTLVKILSGIYQPDSGKTLINGEPIKIDDPHTAYKFGIVCIPQDLTLIPEFTVMENIFIGNEIKKGRFNLIDKPAQIAKTLVLMEELTSPIDPLSKIFSLSFHECQIVQIARAIMHSFQVLILDEPTAFLTDSETDVLFKILQKLRSEGRSIIFISHRLKEVLKITDRVTFLRAGKLVTVQKTSDLNAERMIGYMTGKEPAKFHDLRVGALRNTEPILEVKHLTGVGFTDISFSLHKGEILGLTGLAGAGKSELAKALFGMIPPSSGEIVALGKKGFFTHPKEAIDKGLGFVPDDYRNLGIFPLMSIKANLTLPILKKMVKLLKVDHRQEAAIANNYREKLNVNTPNIDKNVMSLSCGNQKKLILARWLAAHSRILILDQPTAGIDLNAKYELNRMIRNIAMEGVGIIYISLELLELMKISDRLLVMKDGKLTKELVTRNTNCEEVLRYMMGKAI